MPLALVGHLPATLRREYEHDLAREMRIAAVPALVTEQDLAHLPPPVQCYLRRTGVVGKPRVRNFRVRLHGRIRSGPTARWMPLAAEQHNVVAPPVRLFYLRSSMRGIPVQGYHRFVGTEATMKIRAAAFVPVVRAAGPEMNQSETVTLFNDMCIMAPATLIDPAIDWETVNFRTARATFRHAGHEIRATLVFNDAGELANFISDDRFQLSSDGGSARQMRWSTPIGSYRSFGPFRLASAGEGRWHGPDGEFTYIELVIDEVEYNVRGPAKAEYHDPVKRGTLLF